MVAQYTIMADAVASQRMPVANSKGQASARSSGTSFDQHLKEQTKSAQPRDSRADAGTDARTVSQPSKQSDKSAEPATAANQNAAPDDAPATKPEKQKPSATTQSEILVQIDQETETDDAATAEENAELALEQQASADQLNDLPGMQAPVVTANGKPVGEQATALPETPPATTGTSGDAAAEADSEKGNAASGQPGANPAIGSNANGQTEDPSAKPAPTATGLPVANSGATVTDQTPETASTQNETAQTGTNTNEEASAKPAPTPQVPVLDADGAAADAETAADDNASRPSPVTTSAQEQANVATNTENLDEATANAAKPAAPWVDVGSADATADADTDVPADANPATAASITTADNTENAGNRVEDKPAAPQTGDVSELEVARKPAPTALTLPEQQPQTDEAAAAETDSAATIASAEEDASASSSEEAASARPEQIVTKDEMSENQTKTEPETQPQTISNGTDIAANAVNTEAGAAETDAPIQPQSKEEAKAARPEQATAKTPDKSADAATQQSQTGNSQTDAKAANRPSDNQPQTDDTMIEADKPRSAKSDVAARDEPKQAGRQAPKGEAFSQMMAKINTSNSLKDTAMQSDQTLRVDTATATQGDATTVRLTGMEHLGRTGQMPQQASLANAQAIAAQISKFAGKGETRFEIRLDPADLGKVDVRLTIGSDGQTRAHLFVEKSETMDFLMRDQRFLERSLQQSGLNLDKQGVEYSLMDQQGKQQQQMTGEQGQQDFDQDGIAAKQQAEDDQLPAPSVLQPNQTNTYMASNGVNLVI